MNCLQNTYMQRVKLLSKELLVNVCSREANPGDYDLSCGAGLDHRATTSGAALFFMIVMCTLMLTAAGSGYAESTSGELVTPPPRTRVGWVERIMIFPERLAFEAKLSPGSEGNVLHGENIEEFKREGERWMRFTLSDRKGVVATLERPVVSRVKVRTTSGKIERRYEIRLGFCLHDHYTELDFAIRDRSSFEHEARIGRDALAGNFVIDPAATHVTTPRCKRGKVKDQAENAPKLGKKESQDRLNAAETKADAVASKEGERKAPTDDQSEQAKAAEVERAEDDKPRSKKKAASTKKADDESDVKGDSSEPLSKKQAG